MTHASSTRRRGCHWGHIEGPRRNGRATRTRVWICEYPYRTVRLSGPDPDCEGCRQSVAQAAILQFLQAPAPTVAH